MAKHCDVCKREYADNLAACPHCAQAKTTQLAEAAVQELVRRGSAPTDSAVDLGQTPITAKPATGEAPGSGSAVDLGQTPITAKPATGEAPPGEAPPDSGSAISAVEWAALVEEPSSQRIKVDSPSDADLLARGTADADEEMVGELLAEEVAAADLPGHSVEVAQPVSDSAVDLGASPVELVEASSGANVGNSPLSDSGVFVAELASDTSKVDLVRDSGIDVAEDVTAGSGPIAEAGQSGADSSVSGMELTEPAAESPEAVVLEAAAYDELSSAVDLGASPPKSSSEELVPEEIVEGSSSGGIDLEGLAVPASGSGRAPIPSESTVDLGSQDEAPPLATPSGQPVVAGSGVDVTGSGFDFGEAEAPAHVKGSDSDILLKGAEPAAAEGEPPGEDAVVAEAEPPGEDAVVAEGESFGEDAVVAEAGDEGVVAAEEEPAIAAEEEAAIEAKEEEEKPAKPVKQRSRVPALAGGTFLGLLLGIGGTMGMSALMGPGEKEKKTGGPVVPQPQAKAPTFADQDALVRNGDFAKAREAGIEQIQENEPAQVAARGDNRLGLYLQQSGSKVNPQDPLLVQAITDLQNAAKANNADAIYNLGLINELSNNLREARAEYDKGVKLSQSDANQKQRFQSALDRVDLKLSGKVPGSVRLPNGVEDRAALLALLLIGFQAQPALSGDEEAGADFWQAAKLARTGKYADAIKALDKARALHDRRRFTRLRKAQNPLTDPTEDIFLRCCDELKVYWRIQSRLRDGEYLTDKNTPPQAVEDLFQKAKTSETTFKALADKLIKEKIIARPEDLSKGIDRVMTDKKAADVKVVNLTAQLQKAVQNAAAQTTKLRAAEKTIKDRDAQLTAAAGRERVLKAINDKLSGTLKTITDELTKAKFLDPKSKPDVGDAVRKAIDLAKIKDAGGLLRQQQGELKQATAALKQRWRPEEMVPLWRLLLEQNRENPELAGKAVLDAERVKNNQTATPMQKARAGVIQGLALRNTEKFADAKRELQAARPAVGGGEWAALADVALKEVSDPAAYYAGQAQKLYDRGQMDAALALLGRALGALPNKDHGKLFAQRSLIELDAARSKVKGALPLTDPLVNSARKDAAEAVKLGVAEGHYATGRIAEELGQWDAAIQGYRQALAAHPALDADGSRYRIALARVLVQPREAKPVPAGTGGDKVGWRDPAPYPARGREDTKRLALLVMLGLQAPGLPDGPAGQTEAEKLADEVLKAPPGAIPFNVRSQALAVKGLWTPALQTYAEGVRPLLPREYSNGLLYLVENHPRLRRPDSRRTPDPLEAEKHFAAGLNFYFDRDYANAEKEFLLTVSNDNQDARYYYFLGLSRLAQNKRDFRADFEEGAQLERLGRPEPAAVSGALERIQGPTRRIVNESRYRPER